MTQAKASIADLEAHLKASYKLIHFCTQEEKRAEEHLQRLAKTGSRPREYFTWKATDGFLTVDGKVPSNCKDCAKPPEKALQWVMDRERQKCPPAMYVLKDIHPFLGGRSAQALVIRKLKDAVQVLEETYSAIILLGPSMELPVELEKEIVIIDFKPPSFEELRERFAELIADYKGQPGVEINLQDGDLDELARAAKGLTLGEAELAFGKAFTKNKGKMSRADIAGIAEEKKQIVRKTGILSLEEPVRMQDVGGLEVLMKWLEKRKDIFSEEARKFGLPAPKGILLTGVPGCGKSLCAKAMASYWNIPLLRLDMGAVFGSLVGASEANMRRAIQSAEAMAPCILMIDEIEKGLAGMSGDGGGDSGTGSRVFGTLLSWMSDKTAPVFVVATANQFDRLPPEMLRKGRFDELFFVDFPHAGERLQIFSIHVNKALKRREPPWNEQELQQLLAAFGMDAEHSVTRGTKDGGAETVKGTIIQLSNNFTGSEIEEAVKAAMIEAFADDRRRFTSADVAKALAQTVPLIDTMSERIEAIRARARECTVSASRYPTGDEQPVLVEAAPPPAQPDQGAPPSRGGRRMFDMN
jgi:SpoVK/Ycf46/Vps4 family AAA+-type ATPase